MARIRTVKPEFWTDEKIIQLPYEARLLFIGMWNFADDDGCLVDEPDRIKMQVLPADHTNAALLIDLLVAAGLVIRIELPDGRDVLMVKHFAEHQKISHKTPTKLPIKSGKKRIIPAASRRGVALKYGCEPGKSKEAQCYHCKANGRIYWNTLQSGKPGGWVYFADLEIDHLIPENSGGTEDIENLILSCRHCNRSRGSKEMIEFVNFRNDPDGSMNDLAPSGIIRSPEVSGVLRPEGKGMEGNGRERTSPTPSQILPDLAPATRIIAIFDAERSRIFGPELARPFPVSADIVHAQRWVEAGVTEPIARATFAGILDRRKIDGLDPIENLAYFDKPIREALSTPKSTANGHANGAPSETIVSTPEPWPQRVAAWAKNRIWKSEWRYPPDDPRCEAPRELVAQYQPFQEPERAGRAS